MSLTDVGFRALPRLLTPFYAHIRLGLGSLAPWVTFLASITQPYDILSFVFRGHTITKASMPKP